MARILVVEDSPTQAQSLQILLEDAGFQVDLAPDGAVALERLESSIPDLVLSDVVMPELGGHELCRRIRADPRLREIPVILLTSQDDPYEILAALESGADNFLVKPCAPDRLLRRVSAVLDGRRLRAEGQVEGSAEVLFRGRRFRIDSDRERVLDLLVTTLGDVVDREQELAASEARLVEANRELEAFSYSVAHDLGAHLRGIDGFSRLVLQEGATAGLSDTLRSWLGRVTSAADRMRNLIDDLMRLSGVVRGELDRRPVDLAALARHIVADLRAVEPERDVEVVIPPTLPCRGDEGLLRVLLENLLGNAWKFTRGREGAVIEVGALSHGEEAWYVRDNGAGFDSRYAHKLFLPFQRLHSEERFAGTGVGLTTARRVVQRHGGTIWAEGAPGRGATFWFTLPGA
ncbi:MAG: hypothetical protein AMXMBFR64_55200 [Myxococcales bacterium]